MFSYLTALTKLVAATKASIGSLKPTTFSSLIKPTELLALP